MDDGKRNEDEGGILDIQISDTEKDQSRKFDRTNQTEADFQAVKRDYRVNIENGEIHQAICMPLTSGANKQQLQALLHTVEELYFFRRFEEALELMNAAHADDIVPNFDRNTLLIFSTYVDRCRQKLNAQS